MSLRQRGCIDATSTAAMAVTVAVAAAAVENGEDFECLATFVVARLLLLP